MNYRNAAMILQHYTMDDKRSLRRANIVKDSSPCSFIGNGLSGLWLLLVWSIMVMPLQLGAVVVSDFKQNTNIELLEFLTGRFNPAEAVEFVKVGPPYAVRPVYLRRDTFQAYKRMHAAAARAGVRLVIISGFRSYREQTRIWEQHYRRLSLSEIEASERVYKLLSYSAPPGLSRHHWGCEVDLNSVSPNYFNSATGQKVAKWLAAHAKEFDFYLTYNEERLKGFKSEPWQYSYYPVASKIMSIFRLYVSSANVDEFLGSHAVDVDVILDEYTFFINPVILRRMQLEGKPIF